MILKFERYFVVDSKRDITCIIVYWYCMHDVVAKSSCFSPDVTHMQEQHRVHIHGTTTSDSYNIIIAIRLHLSISLSVCLLGIRKVSGNNLTSRYTMPYQIL